MGKAKSRSLRKLQQTRQWKTRHVRRCVRDNKWKMKQRTKRSEREEPNETTSALLVISEHIEMELLSPEGHNKVMTRQHEGHSQQQKQLQLEHPLVVDHEEHSEKQRHQYEPKAESSVQQGPQQSPSTLSFPETIDIEMEVFPPVTIPDSELFEIKSGDSSVLTPLSSHKASRLKWRRLVPPKASLVVKDVLCLPRGFCQSQLERLLAPQGNEVEALASIGLTSRITMDRSWSANQMLSRLVLLFKRRFVKKPGKAFSFIYLQCVQGSRVLFVPETPAEGWTGEQVLRISSHGSLYILSHYDYTQVKVHTFTSEAPAQAL